MFVGEACLFAAARVTMARSRNEYGKYGCSVPGCVHYVGPICEGAVGKQASVLGAVASKLSERRKFVVSHDGGLKEVTG